MAYLLKMNRSLSYQFEKRSCCNESRLGLLDVVLLAVHQPITSFSLYLRSGFHKNQFDPLILITIFGWLTKVHWRWWGPSWYLKVFMGPRLIARLASGVWGGC